MLGVVRNCLTLHDHAAIPLSMATLIAFSLVKPL